LAGATKARRRRQPKHSGEEGTTLNLRAHLQGSAWRQARLEVQHHQRGKKREWVSWTNCSRSALLFAEN
jgi:hypothetical protein